MRRHRAGVGAGARRRLRHPQRPSSRGRPLGFPLADAWRDDGGVAGRRVGPLPTRM